MSEAKRTDPWIPVGHPEYKWTSGAYGFDYNVTVTDHHVCLGCVVVPPKFIETTGRKIIRMMGYHPDDATKWIEIMKYVVEFHHCTDREEDIEQFNERQVITDLLNARVGI